MKIINYRKPRYKEPRFLVPLDDYMIAYTEFFFPFEDLVFLEQVWRHS